MKDQIQNSSLSQSVPANVPSFSSTRMHLPELKTAGKYDQIAGNGAPTRELVQLQAIANLGTAQVIQRKFESGGLPAQLQSGIESLSGVAMHDVRVHYNSSKPAQLQAHAYAQGTDIHIAPGQERHLPHEAWHVVQQKQGRVKPTLQLKGVAINDDSALEREADVMGGRAMGAGLVEGRPMESHLQLGSQRMLQRVEASGPVNQTAVAQLMMLKIMNIGDPDILTSDEKDGDKVRRVGVLNLDEPTLQEAYGDDANSTITVSDNLLPTLKQKHRDLRATGNEILVINAHGSGGRVAGRTAEEFVQLLTDIGATGYQEIHLYACQSGMAIFEFDREVSRRLNCKVWAPRGNTAFEIKLGRYIVRQMTYSGAQQKFVQDGEQQWSEDEGWWCLQSGRVVALGSPQAPNKFPKEVSDAEFDKWMKSIRTVEDDDEE